MSSLLRCPSANRVVARRAFHGSAVALGEHGAPSTVRRLRCERSYHVRGVLKWRARLWRVAATLRWPPFQPT